MERQLSYERLGQFTFNHTELGEILTEEVFNYKRASKWMDDHVGLAVQAVIVYLVLIFSIKFWMRNRQPFNVKTPLSIWNFIIANLSGACALAMSYEYFYTLYMFGVNSTICEARDEYFTGRIGYAVFVLMLVRLPEFIDSFFIVLRKQPLLFIHWYHHAVTLLVGWMTYSAGWPASVHLIFVNSVVHMVMYSYFFIASQGIRPWPIVAKTITFFQIMQFFMSLYGLIYVAITHFFYDMRDCQVEPEQFTIHWMMVVSYTYLFIDFFITRYTDWGNKKSKEID
ncbi:hypothetical protein PMAYCL1PPCAC_16762 [Pristionchus mayeri]|uniref:Elongation of very long chain fatty acids protein n=1 Tax=Pristionchus mayeri TaxID=1317129 RepID=A0AAN5CLH1_9BILA|nr:hypothetical protein PMAYCL1PPCAC_16762 [Pristionchus mayeri]